MTASTAEADNILAKWSQFGLDTFSPFPSALKLAPGLVDYVDASTYDGSSPRLTTTHGPLLREGKVDGLIVELSPGILLESADGSDSFVDSLMSGLLSDSLDLHASNVWSDPAVARQEHHATSGGAVRGREWRRAAAVVHEISALAQIQPGDVCSWNEVTVHHSGNDVLILSGGLVFLRRLGFLSPRVCSFRLHRVVASVSSHDDIATKIKSRVLLVTRIIPLPRSSVPR